MRESINFKTNKILKPITIVTLLYSVLMFLKYIGSLSGIFFEPKNPLIPRFLAYYSAFPAYFIVPFFAGIVSVCLRLLITNNYNFKVVYALFSLVVIFFIFQLKIYQFIMSFNPYGS